jgi:hypothetical protein
MIKKLTNGIVIVWSKTEIEEALNTTLTDEQFDAFYQELQNPSGTFEDMSFSIFDIVLEEVLAIEACQPKTNV